MSIRYVTWTVSKCTLHVLPVQEWSFGGRDPGNVTNHDPVPGLCMADHGPVPDSPPVQRVLPGHTSRPPLLLSVWDLLGQQREGETGYGVSGREVCVWGCDPVWVAMRGGCEKAVYALISFCLQCVCACVCVSTLSLCTVQVQGGHLFSVGPCVGSSG